MSRAKAKAATGAPAWVMTFADLMSLLMCFFVLLLSFSEMDVQKYKQVAGSLREAFGVQRLVESKIMPKGTSIIAQEFSPGRPTPTPINEVRQQTTDETKENLDFSDSEHKGKGSAEHAQESSEQAGRILEMLKEEVELGQLDVETAPGKTIIRIQEKGSFGSGSAVLENPFEPVMAKISDVITQTSGHIVVGGHTDDIPIATQRYRSNWELSAGRAVTVVHHLLRYNALDESRVLVQGHADSRPLVPNDSRANRARNRRVEITIVESEAETAPDGLSH
ncbi:MAG: flagellar motor protein MotB [Gammaproteobacteria bacterium]|nr:flagellar motor protein MotB [Gammaproteobacteria bacterium]MDJ0870816.1 flagellar motor protein MotB [Gammaproteobacteria bacterium]MDJ0891038.1 flagellar motor protein MotB [Gammaproteobacteria bacterium]